MFTNRSPSAGATDGASAPEAAAGAAEQKPGAEVEPAIPLPSDPYLVLQAGQFFLLAAAAVYVARPIVLPTVLALMLKLLLQPGVRLLQRLHLPRSLAALCMLIALFASIVSLGTALSGPAQAWAEKLPSGIPRLQERLSFVRGPIETLNRFLADAENFAHVMTHQGNAPLTPAPAPAPPSALAQALFSGTADFASGFFTTIVLLFFLLVSGDLFLRRFVEILPRFRDKRQAVMVSQQVESDIAAYLLTVTIMNGAVGVATAGVMWLCGLGTPVLWGVLAFMLNYMPILGPATCLVVLLLAGLLSIDWLWGALLPAAGFLLIHLIEGQFVTPMLIARRFTLNPVVVMMSLLFWYWMWGVPGAILAVPMLAMFKIICDGIRPWAAIGHLIGD
jgi:predicted PurR-regulated permease PerM